MAIKANKVSEALRTVTFRFLDDDVTVRYRLGRVNDALVELGRPAENEGENRIRLGHMLERLLLDWDVLDENGEALPVTSAKIEEYDLPLPFLRAVVEVVSDDWAPGKLRKTHSSNGTR